LEVLDALPLQAELNDNDVSRLKDIVKDDADLIRTLLSDNTGIAVINIQLALPENDMFASTESVAYVREMIEPYRASGVKKIYLSGYATSNVSLGEAAALDVQKLVPLTYLLIIIGLVIWLRNISLVVSVLLVVTLTTVMSIGLIGWIDPQLTPILGYVPSIIMIIAIADSMHILISFRQLVNGGKSIEEALRKAVVENRMPIIITSVTTIIGFLALNFNDSPPYRQLGNIVAIGVAVAMFLSLYLLPIMVKRLYKHKSSQKIFGQKFLEYLNQFTANNAKIILFTGVAFLLSASFLATNNKITDHWYHYFGNDFEIRKAIEVLNDQHTGVDILEYHLKVSSDDIFSPGYVKDVEKFATWFEKQTNVTAVVEYASIIKNLNEKLNNTDDEYKIPEKRELIAQLFLMYEMSLPFGLGTDTSVSINRDSTRLTVYLKKTDANNLILLSEAAKLWMQKNTPSIIPVGATGLDIVMSDLNVRNIQNMLLSTVFAFIFIGICLLFTLKSYKLGCIAMLTNVSPAILTYATCYLFWGEIDLASSMVICMSLGIIVDDTVHFLYKYKYKLSETGSHDTAITYTFRTTGTAILITTLILLSGFVVQSFSGFQPTSKVGMLMACTFMFAIIVDLILLPCVLKLVSASSHKEVNAAGNDCARNKSYG
jgi:predicted RND superfamily exporter protein